MSHHRSPPCFFPLRCREEEGESFLQRVLASDAGSKDFHIFRRRYSVFLFAGSSPILHRRAHCNPDFQRFNELVVGGSATVRGTDGETLKWCMVDGLSGFDMREKIPFFSIRPQTFSFSFRNKSHFHTLTGSNYSSRSAQQQQQHTSTPAHQQQNSATAAERQQTVGPTSSFESLSRCAIFRCRYAAFSPALVHLHLPRSPACLVYR